MPATHGALQLDTYVAQCLKLVLDIPIEECVSLLKGLKLGSLGTYSLDYLDDYGTFATLCRKEKRYSRLRPVYDLDNKYSTFHAFFHHIDERLRLASGLMTKFFSQESGSEACIGTKASRYFSDLLEARKLISSKVWPSNTWPPTFDVDSVKEIRDGMMRKYEDLLPGKDVREVFMAIQASVIGRNLCDCLQKMSDEAIRTHYPCIDEIIAIFWLDARFQCTDINEEGGSRNMIDMNLVGQLLHEVYVSLVFAYPAYREYVVAKGSKSPSMTVLDFLRRTDVMKTCDIEKKSPLSQASHMVEMMSVLKLDPIKR